MVSALHAHTHTPHPGGTISVVSGFEEVRLQTTYLGVESFSLTQSPTHNCNNICNHTQKEMYDIFPGLRALLTEEVTDVKCNHDVCFVRGGYVWLCGE